MTVCSDDGSCYVSFKDAAFNVAFTAFYGMYIVKIAQSLREVSVIVLCVRKCYDQLMLDS